ncbi:MAG: DUF2149 domain-containing protein [Pirellulaceae bacterium]|nr:DUF2149 domain-containing protein [Planctomycetales bacterium]
MPRRDRGIHQQLLGQLDEDPLGGIANLFDVAMVFSVALLMALVVRAPWLSLAAPDEAVTKIRHAGEPDMEIVVQQGKKISHFHAGDGQKSGQGQLLGTAYRLSSGEVIYVPASSPQAANP